MINPCLALIASFESQLLPDPAGFRNSTSQNSRATNIAPVRLVTIPEMVDHVGHTEEREDEGAGPAVALPDEVAAGIPSLAKPLLCDGSV